MRTTKIILMAATVFAAAPALAQPYTGTMVVNANVTNTCTVATTNMDVSAGNFRAGFSQTGSVDLWCTNGYAVNVSASSANGWRLVSGANQITYAMTGLTAAFTGTSALTPTAQSFSLDFPAQNPLQGSYTDTVTFTLAP